MSSSSLSITETFESSRVGDSYQPHTSILGNITDRTDWWRKCSADTTHDISDLELDTDMANGGGAGEEDLRRLSRKQSAVCTLL